MIYLTFRPEPIEAMRERFPLAVAEVVDHESIDLGTSLSPFERREHTFHTADGVRLVIARDPCRVHGSHLMLAVSLVADSQLDLMARAGRLDGAALRRTASTVFGAISGRPWVFEEEEDDPDPASEWCFIWYAPWHQPITWTGDRRRQRPKPLQRRESA